MFPLFKTIGSVFRAKLLGIMLVCGLLALASVAALVAVITWVSAHYIHIETAWLDTTVNFLIGIALSIGGWFALPAFTVIFAGLFQEKTIHRIEKVYYPESVKNEKLKFWPDLVHDITFTAWAVFLNLLILPAYAIGIGFPISIALNTYLLGREFFETAANHHMPKKEAKELGKKNRTAVYTGGFVLTLMTLTPVINLFAPVFSVAWMVHVYHNINAECAAAKRKSL